MLSAAHHESQIKDAIFSTLTLVILSGSSKRTAYNALQLALKLACLSPLNVFIYPLSVAKFDSMESTNPFWPSKLKVMEALAVSSTSGSMPGAQKSKRDAVYVVVTALTETNQPFVLPRSFLQNAAECLSRL